MIYRGFELDPFQEQAIKALEAGNSVLVCAPTGTGKTVVADWLVEDALARGKEVIYTAPIKALSNQKFRDYGALVGPENVGLVTGDLVIRRDAACRVMTTEILRNILLSGESVPHLAAVIIDEIHFLDDRDRGTTWEEVLLYLPPEVLVLGLSATLSNLEEFAAWLSHVRGKRMVVVEEHKRAVPLTFAVANRDAGLLPPDEMARFHTRWARRNAGALRQLERIPPRYRKAEPALERPTRHIDVFKLIAPAQLPYLYFVVSRRQAEAYARQLATRMPETLLDWAEGKRLEEMLQDFHGEDGHEALDESLSNLYRMGVAYHHAGLHVQLKALVERLYEAKLIKVLYCTGTFAVGINMPARAAVFDELQRFDGRRMIPLPTREFMQMAGRAGRRGMDEAGMVVVRAELMGWPEMAPLLHQHLRGRYEPVRSSFSLSFNSVVNLLHRHPQDKVRGLVERSFLAFHRDQKSQQKTGKPDTRTWEEFEQKVTFLKNYGYIGEDGSFNAGARVLMHLQIQEIFATELFLQGIFEELAPTTFFGVLTAMCQELPRAAHTSAGKEFKGLARQIDQIRSSALVTDAEKLSGAPVVWDPQMIAFGRWWAEGRTLSELLLNLSSPTDVSGDLVGAFRRARELAGQIKAVWATFAPEKAAMVTALVRTVSRGEVETLD